MQADFTQIQAEEEGSKEESREEIRAVEQEESLDSFENGAVMIGPEMTIMCVFVAFLCRTSQRGFSLLAPCLSAWRVHVPGPAQFLRVYFVESDDVHGNTNWVLGKTKE